jgi:hypothetical protein
VKIIFLPCPETCQKCSPADKASLLKTEMQASDPLELLFQHATVQVTTQDGRPVDPSLPEVQQLLRAHVIQALQSGTLFPTPIPPGLLPPLGVPLPSSLLPLPLPPGMQLLPGLHTPIGARNIPLADPPEESPRFPTGTAVRKLGVDDAPLALVQAQPDAAEGDASASAVRIRAIGASADADEVVPPTALMRDEAAEKLWPGALVRVRRTVLEPSGGWGAVSHDSIGVLRTRHLTDGSASVDFSSDDHPNWACRLDEIEEMAISEAPPMPGFAELRVGAPVRVRESVTTPRGGWGGLDRWIREVGRERCSLRRDAPCMQVLTTAPLLPHRWDASGSSVVCLGSR